KGQFDQGKKSEKTKIRVSHEGKRALQAKARTEIKNLSAPIRERLKPYLNLSSRRAPFFHLSSSRSVRRRAISVPPPTALAVVAAAFTVGCLSLPISTDNDVGLIIHGDFPAPESASYPRQEFYRAVFASYGETGMIEIDDPLSDSHDYLVQYKARHLSGGATEVYFEIIRGLENGTLVATPYLIAEPSGFARISFTSESGMDYDLAMSIR
ncbi:MAG: hypothetical protein AAFP81_05265, partial [Pseudomonadota bacterium]